MRLVIFLVILVLLVIAVVKHSNKGTEDILYHPTEKPETIKPPLSSPRVAPTSKKEPNETLLRFSADLSGWICPQCETHNDDARARCIICDYRHSAERDG